jgi:hypothetical protein
MPCSKRYKATHLWEPQRVCECVLCLFTALLLNVRAILDPALRRSEASLQLLLPVLRIAKGNFNEGIV